MNQMITSIEGWTTGYQKFGLMDRITELELDSHLEELKAEFLKLTPDEYDKMGRRSRSYARGAYYPWKNSFEWFPDEPSDEGLKARYFQGEHNPEHVNAWRVFSAVSPALKQNRVLSEIVMNAAMRARFENENAVRPIGVGVHLIRQFVDEKNPLATVSPNVMHQDGELYDYVYLIERDGVDGGENCVAEIAAKGTEPDEVDTDHLIKRFTLHSELEGFGIRDESVCHGVGPIKLSPGSKTGFRHTILVDLTPMYERLW